MADTTAPSPTGGNVDWGTLLSSLFSGYQGITGQAGKDATTAANRADPWGPQRGQYQDQLNAFMKDPSTIFQDPAFQAARNQGLEGVARTMGASGMGNSGNTQAALYKYGDTFAYDAENNKFKQLADLAGVNAGSPEAAGRILAQGNNNRNANIGSGLSGIGNLISQLTAAGVPAAIINALKGAFGGGGGAGDLFGGDLSGSGNFDPGSLSGLTTPGGEFGVDPGNASDINNILGGNDTTPMFPDQSNFGDISGSSQNLLGDLIGNIFGGGP